MKTVFTRAVLVLCVGFVAGCYKSQPDPNSPFSRPPGGDEESSRAVGFTAHAWCFIYNDGRQDLEDRFMFEEGGSLNYQRSSWVGQRGPLLGQADGTWSLNGTVLQMNLGGKRLVYQTQYYLKDPQNGRERIHIFKSGRDIPYDACL